jgi:HPt (histidine-containing phosphotransfer) domain-containing protein
MTANAFSDDRKACQDAGMNDFIAKPVDPEQLFEALSRWLPAAGIEVGTPAKVNVLPAALTAIPGLDAQRGLHTLCGHREAYLKLLRAFVSEHAEEMTRLREKLSQGDHNEARRRAHSLKGSAGNLGATELQAFAAGLEAAIREGRGAATIESLAGQTEDELHRLHAQIMSALPNDVSGGSVIAMNARAARRLFDHLERLVASNDIEANRVFETHAESLKLTLGPLGSELEQRIRRCDFPGALEILGRARRNLPEA